MSKNDKYKGFNISSPYQFKQNVNQLIDDIANLSFRNIIKNERLSRFSFNGGSFVWDTSGIPVEWTSSATGNNFVYNNSKSVSGTILAGQHLRQDIAFDLKPNTQYTCLIYTNSSASGMVIGVSGVNSNQVYNSDPESVEINKATFTTSETTALSKNVIQFTTNATEVSGSVYFIMQNPTTGSLNIDVKYVSTYEGSIEVAETTPTDVKFAEQCNFAVSAQFVTENVIAESANYAASAGTAVSATNAANATTANFATSASSANFATNSATATWAVSAMYVLPMSGVDADYAEKTTAIVGADYDTYTLWFDIPTSGISCNVPVSSSSTFDALSFNTTSKREYKENIEVYEQSALDIINSVEVVSFVYKADLDKENKVGFIADDTNEILAGKEHDKMDIANCVGILIKAVQELTKENNQLKEKLNEILGN